MSTEETQRKPTQDKQESSAQAHSTQQNDGKGRPLPFDDDDIGGSGDPSQSTDPQKPPIDPEF